MQKAIYAIFTVIFFTSCAKTTDGEKVTSNVSATKLQGAWEWVSSTGGIAGITSTPTSLKIVKSIYIGKNVAVFYENGNQKKVSQFTIQTKKSIYNHKKVPMLVYGNSKQSFEITSKTLLLKDEIYDGFVHLYKKVDCVTCNEAFYTIQIEVKNKKGNPIALDKVEVIRKDTNKNITNQLIGSEWKTHQKWGSYPIYSDLFVEQDKGKTLTINFKGYSNNKLVVDVNTVVGADCCHVFYVSGDRKITIN